MSNQKKLGFFQTNKMGAKGYVWIRWWSRWMDGCLSKPCVHQP